MTWSRLASDCNRNSIVGVLTEQHISQSLCRTSLHNPHHANGVHNARTPHGQSRPWNHQMQQNWSQSYNIPNPPYWPAPAQPRPQQNWSQNYPRNLQVQPPVQGQTRPVITQTQTQQKSHYKNGNQPMKITSAGSSQNQGHIGKPPGQKNGVNFARPAPISQWRPRPQQ